MVHGLAMGSNPNSRTIKDSPFLHQSIESCPIQYRNQIVLADTQRLTRSLRVLIAAEIIKALFRVRILVVACLVSFHPEIFSCLLTFLRGFRSTSSRRALRTCNCVTFTDNTESSNRCCPWVKGTNPGLNVGCFNLVLCFFF